MAKYSDHDEQKRVQKDIDRSMGSGQQMKLDAMFSSANRQHAFNESDDEFDFDSPASLPDDSLWLARVRLPQIDNGKDERERMDIEAIRQRKSRLQERDQPPTTELQDTQETLKAKDAQQTQQTAMSSSTTSEGPHTEISEPEPPRQRTSTEEPAGKSPQNNEAEDRPESLPPMDDTDDNYNDMYEIADTISLEPAQASPPGDISQQPLPFEDNAIHNMEMFSQKKRMSIEVAQETPEEPPKKRGRGRPRVRPEEDTLVDQFVSNLNLESTDDRTAASGIIERMEAVLEKSSIMNTRKKRAQSDMEFAIVRNTAKKTIYSYLEGQDNDSVLEAIYEYGDNIVKRLEERKLLYQEFMKFEYKNNRSRTLTKEARKRIRHVVDKDMSVKLKLNEATHTLKSHPQEALSDLDKYIGQLRSIRRRVEG